MSLLHKNLANLITLTRLVASAILLCYLNKITKENLENKYIICVALLFFVICISDFIDGKVARKLEIVSSFGASFDVYTDFFYVFSSLILLCIKGLLPIWFIVLVTEKTLNFYVTSYIYQKKKKNKFSYIKDPIGKYVSSYYFFVPIMAFILYLFLNQYYALIYLFILPPSVAGVISSIYRIRLAIKA